MPSHILALHKNNTIFFPDGLVQNLEFTFGVDVREIKMSRTQCVCVHRKVNSQIKLSPIFCIVQMQIVKTEY